MSIIGVKYFGKYTFRNRRMPLKLNILYGSVPAIMEKSETAFSKAIDTIERDQEAVADTVDVHPSTISRWKKGIRKPQFDNLRKISKTMGKKPEVLFPQLKI